MLSEVVHTRSQKLFFDKSKHYYFIVTIWVFDDLMFVISFVVTSSCSGIPHEKRLCSWYTIYQLLTCYPLFAAKRMDLYVSKVVLCSSRFWAWSSFGELLLCLLVFQEIDPKLSSLLNIHKEVSSNEMTDFLSNLGMLRYQEVKCIFAQTFTCMSNYFEVL